MIPIDFQGKTVIVTGGNEGIGKSCVKVFCQAGANVVFGARRKNLGLEVEEEINGTTPGKCLFFQCDVSRDEEVKAMVDYTVGEFGGIDCIVNNAAYGPPRGPADDIPIEDFQNVLKTNLTGVFSGCKHALPYIRSRQGSIINISSILAIVGQEGNAHYAATKGGILSLTKSLAIDEARNQVRVNAVLPGKIFTDIGQKNQTGEYMIPHKKIGDAQWLGEGGDPDQVAYTCLFLASDLAGYITGADIYVTGGFELGNGVRLPRFDWTERMQKK